MLELPPLGLYVHIPWCVRKCPYCDFNSHERPGEGIPEADYVERLEADLKHELARAKRLSLQRSNDGNDGNDGTPTRKDRKDGNLGTPTNGNLGTPTKDGVKDGTTKDGTPTRGKDGTPTWMGNERSNGTPTQGSYGKRNDGTPTKDGKDGTPTRTSNDDNDGTTTRVVQTVFFGGGTPSLFLPASFGRLLDLLSGSGVLAPGAEITLEANPGTAESARFAAYREAGVNRLSLGVQSFNDRALAKLGRIHNGAESRSAIAMARAAGFGNINLDLMFGLSGQSREQALQDLATAISFQPEHISWYQLTLEPNTVFWRRPPRLPENTVVDAMQDAGLAMLENAGYTRYEVSAFALAGSQCRHNINYWAFGDYLGIGAGAHGKVTDPVSDRIFRTRKTRQPMHFLSPGDRTATRAVDRSERPLEFLMNALRLRTGFSAAQFESRTGIAFEEIEEKIKCLVGRELLELDGQQARATRRGYRLLDSILGEFI